MTNLFNKFNHDFDVFTNLFNFMETFINSNLWQFDLIQIIN